MRAMEEITAGRENLKLPHFTLTKYRKRALKKNNGKKMFEKYALL